MRPDEMRRHGVALAERVRREVDTSVRLDLLLRRRRRSRVVVFAAAAVTVLVLVAGSLWLTGIDDSPVVTEPPTTAAPTTAPPTTRGLESLPVEVYMVLLTDYAVEPRTGLCEGAGALTGVGEGSGVEVIDPSSTEAARIITLSSGEEVTVADERAGFLLPDDITAACVFTLPDLGYGIDEYGDIMLLPESDPDIATGMTIRGQRVVFGFGKIPGESVFEPTPGVVSDDPEVWLAELEALRDSAGPGRIVGFINLAAPHHSGAPTSPDQPVCLGIGPYRDVVPGAPVTVTDTDGQSVSETMLRGSAYDGHIGCSLWFGADVAAGLDAYLLGIGDHALVTFERADLDSVGWKVDLWSDADHMQTNCVELADESQPTTCVLLEPLE